MSKFPETVEAEEAIVQYLESKKGARLCCQQVANHFGWTLSYASRILLNLSRANRILIALSRRDKTYYVPDEENIAKTSPIHMPLPKTELKVDKYRRELYRELAEARAAIPSIG